MSLAHLLQQLTDHDIHLSVAGDRLRVDAPKGVLTPELRDRLARHKTDILAALTPKSTTIITPDDLPWDWACEWLERAAIREFDGGQAREHAEAEALAEVVQRMRSASDPPVPAGGGEAWES